MNAGLIIALLALAIGFVAILKIPRNLFTQGVDPALEARLEGERLDFAERSLGRAEQARRLAKGD